MNRYCLTYTCVGQHGGGAHVEYVYIEAHTAADAVTQVEVGARHMLKNDPYYKGVESVTGIENTAAGPKPWPSEPLLEHLKEHP